MVHDYVKEHWSEEDGEMSDSALDKRLRRV